MSKGSPIVPIRIPPDLLGEMERVIAARNVVTRGEPWTRTGFVISAIREKLLKMERSRRGKAVKPPIGGAKEKGEVEKKE